MQWLAVGFHDINGKRGDRVRIILNFLKRNWTRVESYRNTYLIPSNIHWFIQGENRPLKPSLYVMITLLNSRKNTGTREQDGLGQNWDGQSFRYGGINRRGNIPNSWNWLIHRLLHRARTHSEWNRGETHCLCLSHCVRTYTDRGHLKLSSTMKLCHFLRVYKRTLEDPSVEAGEKRAHHQPSYK